MVKIEKEYEGKYYVYNNKTGACADIVRIYEYNPLGKDKTRYRVDYQGGTKLSMVTLNEAKSYARKLVKCYVAIIL